MSIIKSPLSVLDTRSKIEPTTEFSEVCNDHQYCLPKVSRNLREITFPKSRFKFTKKKSLPSFWLNEKVGIAFT